MHGAFTDTSVWAGVITALRRAAIEALAVAVARRRRSLAAVASLFVGPVRLTGTAGWLVWLLGHLVYMTGFKNRLSALAGWVITFVGRDRRQATITEQQVFARTRCNDQPRPEGIGTLEAVVAAKQLVTKLAGVPARRISPHPKRCSSDYSHGRPRRHGSPTCSSPVSSSATTSSSTWVIGSATPSA